MRRCFLLLSFLLMAAVGVAQNTPDASGGIMPYQSYHGGALDSVNLQTGSLVLHGSFISYPQRGKDLTLGFSLLYNGRPFAPQYFCPPQMDCWWQWAKVNDRVPFRKSVGLAENGIPYLGGKLVQIGHSNPPTYKNFYTVYEPDGATHPMGDTYYGGELESIDATGYQASAVNDWVIDRRGVLFPYGSSVAMEDPNGNQISGDTSGDYIDTLGRVIPPATSTSDFTGCTGTLAIASASMWNFPSPNGATFAVKLCYATVQVNIPDDDSNGIEGGSGSITALQSIVLPSNAGAWTFAYSDRNPSDDPSVNYGDLTQITMPSGGTISYTYTTPGISARVISSRTVCDPNNCGTWIYSWLTAYTNTTFSNTVTDPAGNDTVHVFTYLNGTSPYETETRSYQGSQTNGTLLQTVDTSYNYNANPYYGSQYGQYYSGPQVINVTPASVKTTLPNGFVKQASTQYDSGFEYYNSDYAVYGLPTAVTASDWGQGNPGATLRQTTTGYQAFANNTCLTWNLLNYPHVVTTYGNGGPPAAQTTHNYDEQTPDPSYVSQQHDNSPQNGSCRGNETSTVQLLNPGNQNVITSRRIFDTGEVHTSTDPNFDTTTYTYDSSLGGPYPTEVQLPTTNGVQHITTYGYDFNSSLMTSSTDQNGQTTTYASDSLFRLTQVLHPLDPATNLHPETDFFYPNPTTVEESRRQDSTTWLYDYAYYDGLGREVQTRHVDPEGDDYVNTAYDALGHVLTVSNPYRSSGSSPTDGTTCNGTIDSGVCLSGYDALGRLTVVTKQDGNTVQTNYLNFPIVTVTDETLRKRQSTTDALGRMTQVIEPNPTTGSLTSGSYPTNYTYDALGNLLSVNQVGDGSAPRTRSFSYDSLSRLLSATNPETGTITYSYAADANCNPGGEELRTKTDARGTTTTYCYDQLHRVLSKTFVDAPSENYTTAAITYGYDNPNAWGRNLTNTIGRLVTTQTADGAGSDYSYDSMGRQTREEQCIPWGLSGCGVFTGSYDLAGNLQTLSYGSGRFITDSYTAAGRLGGITFTGFGGSSVAYQYYNAISNSQGYYGYWPGGQVHVEQFGSGAANALNFNSRLQQNGAYAGAPSGWNVNSLNRWMSKSYTMTDANNHNNGNVMVINDDLNANFTLTHNYDQLNRLTAQWSADATINESFAFDPWGNLKQSGNFSFVPTAFDSGNHVAQNGYGYDAAGNLLMDTFHTYVYDAEDQIRSLDSGTTTYLYDADGRRVAKNVGGQITNYFFWGSEPVAELNPNTGDWSDYIYANGKRFAKADSFQKRVLISGSECANCTGQGMSFAFPNAAGLNGYTVQAGDKLYVAQYNVGATLAGVGFAFGDGTSGWQYAVQDQDGQSWTYDYTQNAWHFRVMDLQPVVGKVIAAVYLQTDGIPATGGNWSAYFEDFVLVSADGTVHPVYTGQDSVSLAIWQSSGQINGSATVDKLLCSSNCGGFTTTYYHEDHLGTSRLMTSYGGWPVWQGTFLPYGQEWNPQIGVNHYKFTGKERDTESNLDYFGARYYSSTMGRWMSPDWADKPEAVPYADLSDPQSLNLYGYVRNNPMNHEDPDGHFDCGGKNGQGAGCQAIANWNAEHDVEPPQSNSLAGRLTSIGNKIDNKISKASDFLNDHPLLALIPTFGMSAEKDGPELIEIVEDAGEAVESKAELVEEEAVSVYQKVENEYVGISNNLPRRENEHGEELKEVVGGLTRTQARGVEQAIIEKKGLAKNGGMLMNKINSISNRKPIYQDAVEFGRQLLRRIGF